MRHILELADARTAQLRVERAPNGILQGAGEGLQGAFLLPPARYLEAQPKITLESGGKTKRLQPRPSAKVLLLDFAERFDRSVLAVAEIEADL